jgi:hypothetical protein
MTSVAPSTPSRTWSRRSLGFVALLALGLVATSCSSGPGSKQDFIEVLSRGDAMTTEEATCIADAVFDRYGDDSDALGKLSAAPDFEFLSSAEGIDGFAEFYDRAVQSCVQVGPTAE